MVLNINSSFHSVPATLLYLTAWQMITNVIKKKSEGATSDTWLKKHHQIPARVREQTTGNRERPFQIGNIKWRGCEAEIYPVCLRISKKTVWMAST